MSRHWITSDAATVTAAADEFDSITYDTALEVLRTFEDDPTLEPSVDSLDLFGDRIQVCYEVPNMLLEISYSQVEAEEVYKEITGMV